MRPGGVRDLTRTHRFRYFAGASLDAGSAEVTIGSIQLQEARQQVDHLVPRFIDQQRFLLGDACFRLEPYQFSLRTTEAEIVILKNMEILSCYDAYFSCPSSNNILEVGVFEGGSLLYMALRNPGFRFVGIDLRPVSPIVLRHIERLGLSDRVRIYDRVGQADEQRIRQIVNEEFGSEGIGLVIDDASHMYHLSRRTFEILFPLVVPHGTYCIEDWAWCHWPEPYQTNKWTDQVALSNLAFEIVMLLPSLKGSISDIRVTPGMIMTRKGSLPLKALSLDSAIRKRGRNLGLI